MLWLIVGIVIGAAVIYLANNRQLRLSPLDWVLFAVGIVFLLLAIANYTGSMQEREPLAAGVLLASFGLPALILFAIAGVRVWRRRSQVPPLVTGKPERYAKRRGRDNSPPRERHS